MRVAAINTARSSFLDISLCSVLSQASARCSSSISSPKSPRLEISVRSLFPSRTLVCLPAVLYSSTVQYARGLYNLTVLQCYTLCSVLGSNTDLSRKHDFHVGIASHCAQVCLRRQSTAQCTCSTTRSTGLLRSWRSCNSPSHRLWRPLPRRLLALAQHRQAQYLCNSFRQSLQKQPHRLLSLQLPLLQLLRNDNDNCCL